MTYEFLEHDADVRVRCTAPDFEGVLRSAGQALYAVTLANVHESVSEQQRVHIEGSDREELLIGWLQELLFLLETAHFVATACVFEFDSGGFHAALRGYIHGPDERSEEVKAATYHGLTVADTATGVEADVILDV